MGANLDDGTLVDEQTGETVFGLLKTLAEREKIAVVLATLTTVVVFLPMIFMSENPLLRIMFGELGLPLCLSLLFSLAVALIFLPVVAARLVGPRPAMAEAAAVRLARVVRLPGERWVACHLVA